MSQLVRKISSHLTFTVLDRKMDAAIHEISAVALLLNILCLYGFGAASLIITTVTGPFKRGFFCDDESIRLKFHYNTIPAWLLVTVSIGVSVLCILACEFYVLRKLEASISRPTYKWKNSHIHAYFIDCMIYFGYSQIGYICNFVLTQITKYTVGRLRPHFMDVCKPSNYTCTTDHDYITDYVCTGDRPERINEGRLSFFSGHSSIAMYSAVFTILYLQSRLGGRITARLVLPVVQTTVLVIAMVTCYTRISDNWHHWSDVLCGALIGIAVAIYTTVFWADMFSHRRRYVPIGDPSSVCIVNNDTGSQELASRSTGLSVAEEERGRASSMEQQLNSSE